MSLTACGGDTEPPRDAMAPGDTSGNDTPANGTPANGTPANGTPANDTPANDTPADEALPPTSQEQPPLVVSPLRDAFADLIDDAWAQPEEARPYLRYVLASRGAAGLEREQERLALLRLVNSTSLSPQVTAPTPLAEQLAYRLDLRDYLWDRPVGVGGVTFSDGWEAIVERSGLALPRLPDDPLAALTGTSTAVLSAGTFLTTASSGSLYYALTGAPGAETELQERLAARFPDPESEQVHNAAFGGDSRHDYQGARRLLLPDGKAYWQGLPGTPRGNSIFSSPFTFNSWETDAIYPLPNGFPAFFLDASYLDTAPAPRTRLRARVKGSSDELVADCIACHSSGPVPMNDIFDDYLRGNARDFGPDAADIMSQWPSQQELDAAVAADNAAYQRVLDGAGLSVESAAALQAITRRYAAGLDLADMAAALHASELQVRAVLPAGTTSLDAVTFVASFRALLCQIHPDASGDPAFCR